jgi:S-layer homology domain
MKKRLWWSVVLSFAALICLTLASEQVASAQSGPVLTGTGPDGPFSYNPRASVQRPGLINPLCGSVGGPAIADPACNSQDGREWEGTASTDYFNYEPNVFAPPNPDIAAGPDDILTIVNRTISKYPNPNAPTFTNNGGTAPVPYSPANTFFLPPDSKNFLDVWIGEAALNELCPTFPRNNASCVIDNATVRYDQMQGRFLVLFTVVDTGLVNCSGCAGVPTQVNATLRRKASWVLIVSRWATGCTGTGGGFATACVPNTNPAVPGGNGNTEFFTTPQPPGPNQANPNSGGTNGNWLIYYGSVGAASTTQGSDTICPANGCTFGNINDISDIRRGQPPAASAGARIIDCNNTAVGDTTRVCYFPSSARLGIDNDNIQILSSVYDDNQPLATRGLGNNATWQGTRLRVWKKGAIYTGLSTVTGPLAAGCPASPQLCPGAAQATPQLQGDWYDLWATAASTDGGGVTSPASPPFAFDTTVNQIPCFGRCQPAGAPAATPITLPGPGNGGNGLQYEPLHVRGRALGTFNGNLNLDNAFTSLLGAVASQPPGGGQPQVVLYLRTITYTREVQGSLTITPGTGDPATVNQPLIQGGIPRLNPFQTIFVPAFTNPDSVTQRDKLVQPQPNNQLPTPYLYVGDDRPHRLVGREGELYDARVAEETDFFRFDPANPLCASGNCQTSTVVYDIIQKLTPAGAPISILNTSWGNGRYYAPMYDVPANVVQYGSVSPINLLPFLEKLFVGTTFPPLAPSDPRTFAYGLISGQALIACKGQDPGAPAASASSSLGAYPGLFDIRCGEDAYDTAQAYRHPITGAFTPTDFQLRPQPSPYPNQIVPFGIRGGASTDVNNLGLWLYGAYAKGRLASIPGIGQWGTYVAHYPLSFPIRDPYNNLNNFYTDVQPGNPFFPFVQIAKQTEIDPGSRTATTFNPDGLVLRRDMAKWVVRAQADETAITSYLNSTGGIFCSFADVECPGSSGTVTNTTGTTEWRYIETMYRRGYTKGCSDTGDGQRRFCPGRTLTRGEMAVFIIRAKMNSVFPTVTSGTFTTSTCSPPGTVVTQVGDQFGLFAGCRPYFSDVPNTHIYYSFIQKLRELRVTNGTGLSATSATYSPDNSITRKEIMVFLVKAFFP